MIIWFATGNGHKRDELASILSGAISTNNTGERDLIELKIPGDLGIDFNPEETGADFLENALIKARELKFLLEKHKFPPNSAEDPVIAEDSGICVDALGGKPGIHSARYCGRYSGRYGSGSGRGGNDGKSLSAAEKNALLLEELAEELKNAPPALAKGRKARFVCSMVLYFNRDRFYAVQETVEGELVKSIETAAGKGGFGYDPIFYIPELGRTMAELSAEEKNRLSHRGKAGRLIGRLLCRA